jgi:hypothetical protein
MSRFTKQVRLPTDYIAKAGSRGLGATVSKALGAISVETLVRGLRVRHERMPRPSAPSVATSINLDPVLNTKLKDISERVGLSEMQVLMLAIDASEGEAHA